MTELILFSSIPTAALVLAWPRQYLRWLPWLAGLGHLIPYLTIGRVLISQTYEHLGQFSLTWFTGPSVEFSLTTSNSSAVLLVSLLPLFLLMSAGIWQGSATLPSIRRKWRLAANLTTHGAIVGLVTAASLVNIMVFWPIALFSVYLAVVAEGADGHQSSPKSPFWQGGFTLRNSLFAAAVFSTLLLSYSLISLGTAGGYEIANIADTVAASLEPTAQWWILLGLFAAMAIVLPVFPVHGWVHGEGELSAPTATLLFGLIGKIGMVVFIAVGLRVLPDAAEPFSWAIRVTGAVSLIYSLLAAFGAKDSGEVTYHAITHSGALLVLVSFGTPAAAQALGYGLILTPYLIYLRYLVAALGRGCDDATSQAKQSWITGVSFGVLLALLAFLPGSPGFAWIILSLSALRMSWLLIAAVLGWVVLNASCTIANREKLVSSAGSLAPRRDYLLVILTALLLISGLLPGPLLGWLNPFTEILTLSF